MKTKSTLIPLLFAISLDTPADTLKEGEINGFLDSFMSEVINEKYREAFFSAAPYMQISEEEILGVASKTQKRRGSNKYLLGNSFAYELVSKQKAGQSLIKYDILEKAESGGVYWSFYFYKNQTGWNVYHFEWKDDITKIFD